ncbi:tRNA pseudouridine synthase domain-containing protein [Hirsutella rhossiliensis]|uniref:tRNA pseudouridine synthase domain-containing protein n=1 Tax=Hirsutella rhossiliensis TaxID=111463 RepID=A0A9P8SG51_9HYPO|nr:tRNA pseudouridine synthase domain-containing protein [Hirsutella rhossiliensis]KAH0960769.1 tRNA pseudouridine synthase domain-containing protein [Hirsutella rhossiliensis]
MAGDVDYNNWTKTGLIQRLRDLEEELKRRPATQQAEKPPKGERPMDPSRYSSRYIALKLAYLGKNYGGFEYSAMSNQPSIEEELWNALTKAHLIFPEDERVVQFECCDYSKCGRTDRGVSAFGQVIGLRVRSSRPLPTKRVKRHQGGPSSTEQDAAEKEEDAAEEEEEAETKPFDHVADELCYPRILNRILPSDIRILAWCPSPPPGFSARFSCRERQYRYLFTQPAFAPGPLLPSSMSNGGSGSSVKTGWLDIEAMRDAAKRFEGEHDFRNLCKLDPSKQITDFTRYIFESDIVEVEDVHSALPYLEDAKFAASGVNGGPHPKVYYFHVRGSAFLWHQIRHMVAILFLVGQGLEAPTLVSELLDVSKNPRKPGYAMANEVPLVLWDCVFPGDALEWVYVGDECTSNKFGQYGLVDGLWQVWRGHKMDELLANQLLRQVSQQGALRPGSDQAGRSSQGNGKASASVRIFQGADSGRLAGRYTQVMKSKDFAQSVEEQNEKYAKRKGYAGAADMRTQRGIGRWKDEQKAAEG